MAQTIAFAEDEPDLREAVAEFLRARGFNVIDAGTGAELRAAVAGRPVDLALLDIMMPGEDGLALAQWFKGQGPVGLILATALGRPQDVVLGLDTGADDYVVKPYDLHELLARIQSVLRRRPGAVVAPAVSPGPMPAAPGLILDPERRLAILSGTVAPLSEAEYALIAHLAARRGRLVTREALAEALGMAGDPRAVDVRVARLRRKLTELPGGEAALRTVRGEGYVLDDAEPALSPEARGP